MKTKAKLPPFLLLERVIKQITPEAEIQAFAEMCESENMDVTKSLGLLAELVVDPAARSLLIESGLVKKYFLPQTKFSPEDLNTLFTILDYISVPLLMRKELIRHKIYSSLFLAYLEAPKNSGHGPRNVLGRGNELREQICEDIPKVLGRLGASLREEAPDDRTAIGIAGMMLMLMGHSSEPRTAAQPAIDTVFSFVSSPSVSRRNRALDCLMEAAANDLSRPILLSLGTKELLKPYASRGDDDAGFLACLILALLAAGDRNDTNESGGEPTPPSAITVVLAKLKAFADRAISTISTVKGYSAHCVTLLIAVRSMATNEANIKALRERGVVDILISLLKNRTDDLFRGDLENLEQVRLSSFPSLPLFPLLKSVPLFLPPWPFYSHSSLLALPGPWPLTMP